MRNLQTAYMRGLIKCVLPDACSLNRLILILVVKRDIIETNRCKCI